MPIEMYDSVTPNAIPAQAPAVAGHIDGPHPTFGYLRAQYPNAQQLSIAISASDNADCLDVEAGDALPAQVPAWVRQQVAHGVQRPVVYTSLTTVPAVVAVLTAAGLSTSAVRIWTAHYTESAHLCSPQTCGTALQVPADATQWTNHAAGTNLNESLCSDTFFGPPPPPPDPYHYEWYPDGPDEYQTPPASPGAAPGPVLKLNPRLTCEEYDHLRVHAQLNIARLNQLRTQIAFLAQQPLPTALNPEQRAWVKQQMLARSRGESVTS